MSSTLASLGNDTQVELSKFSSTNYIDGGREFLNSNSAVAKFAFLLLVVILFILLLSINKGGRESNIFFLAFSEISEI